MAATRAQKLVAARVLADGGSYSKAATAAGVSRRTVARWDTTGELPDPTPITTPRAVLEFLLTDPSPKIRLDAASKLLQLEVEDSLDAPEEWDRVIPHDCQPGEERTELHVYRVRPDA
jgi:Homeodomain-like domain